jgi:putative tricarboxylic transport membrane protein
MLFELLHPNILIPWMLGIVFGVFVGSTPGLTATMAVALILPLTFHLGATAGLAMIIGVSFTAIFAGDIPATFLRIPGTPASAAATLDGYQLARRGQGGLALLLDLLCSSLGGLLGVSLLILVAPQLARFALTFSHFEYFWLGVLGLSLSALVSQGSTIKGIASATLGVLLSTVGQDIVSGTPRFTGGTIELLSGIDFIPAMIGLFGLAEVFRNLHSGKEQNLEREWRVTLPWREAGRQIAKYWRALLQSSVVGTLVGALPGAGADIAAWAAYGLAQKTSTNPEKFGQGTAEGVIAPTSANNAAVAGAWIPALVFGVPGDAVTAIVLGALLMHDIHPGPALFERNADQLHLIFGIALITQLLLIPAGILGIKAFGWMMQMPRSLILTGVVIFSMVGAFALNQDTFDLYVVFVFGLLGFGMERVRAPVAPLILGMILGPVLEENLRVGLIKEAGSLLPFFQRPICQVMIFLLFVAIVATPLSRWFRRPRHRHGETD